MLKLCDIIRWLLAVLIVLSATSCVADEDTSSGSAKASLAFSVSTQHASTRMTAEATQQEGSDFRGITNQRFYPFSTEGEIQGTDTPLGDFVSGLGAYESTLFYYKNKGLDIPVGTASFLCYCSADGTLDEFTGGAIDAEITNTTEADDISFSPKQIYKNVTTADEKAEKIAEYLTHVANAIKNSSVENKDDLFNQFINYGHIIPASSSYVAGLESWLSSESIGITLPTNKKPTNFDNYNYPASINLPDGAAVVQWNSTEEKFTPVLQTTTQANINSLNRFVYPAPLWYYANSRIKTSYPDLFDKSNNIWEKIEQLHENNQDTWENILALHENDDAIVYGGEASIAIKEPLHYAVGCLELELDAATTILNREKYPLTGVFISSQYPQKFDFTPNATGTECIIYDKTIPEGFTMASPGTGENAKKNYTLAFQTPDDKDVRIALEFKNNGDDFPGIETMDLDGHPLKSTIFSGTKFYLVGTLNLPTPTTEDHTKRVFTKDYITYGKVIIKDLSQAHPYLPDLLDPRLEVGIEVELKWIPAEPTNVPL